ncbi:hypothetical protein FZX09_03960 [Synechococcus sp. MU1643]|uniref:hypothetical protein n=1 Tax=Synechococcus sp. MU1643 TaxID=2508349 RepID=UPI001CF903E1|nr:hypothetical protein [Synechococcus sp. MU1643]MCB4427968.1 hypothetical protein [Synechococcus sp. MU1643]
MPLVAIHGPIAEGAPLRVVASASATGGPSRGGDLPEFAYCIRIDSKAATTYQCYSTAAGAGERSGPMQEYSELPPGAVEYPA